MGAKIDPERLKLANYPYVTTLRARFGDMDPLGHLNNVALASFYEEARVSMNRELFGLAEAARRTGEASRDERAFPVVVARVTIDYLGEVLYPGEYQVGVGVGRVGTSSIVQVCGLFDGEVCLGLCEAVIVYRPGPGSAPLPDEARDLLATMAFPAQPASA